MLLFGKQYTNKNKNKIGGVIKLFELFKEELSLNSVDYEVVDLNWRNYKNPVFAYMYIYYCAVFRLKKHSSVSFHGTANEFIYLAPLVVFVGNLFGKKVSLRKFAGNFDQVYSGGNFVKKYFIEYALKRSNYNFFETKYLVNYFVKFNSSTFWFPNVRPENDYCSNLIYNKKFIFIGHVVKDKGIRELIDAFLQLGSEFTLDIYGPLGDHFTQESCSSRNTNYCGILSPESVCSVLKDYDVLILPSYREGYPGVIIEAFSVGIPVIASSLESICEMVIDNVNGKLIEPKNVQQLVTAIKMINSSNYEQLSVSAANSFDNFDSGKITKHILELI